MVSHYKDKPQRYDLKYRRKIQLKRLTSESFDLELKEKQNARQRKYRRQKQEARQQSTATLVPSTTTSASLTTILTPSTTKSTLRKAEGARRRRANTRKLKKENEKLLKEVQNLRKENLKMNKLLSQLHSEENNTGDATPVVSPTKLFIDNVSPLAKKRATKRLIDKKDDLSRGSISKLRRTLGINLSNNYSPPSTMSTTLKKDIEEFLCQDDVTKQAPDKKKHVNGEQIRYLLNHLSTLHQRFVAETDNNCHYSTFTRYVPDFILKPNANDWGTCLCATCLNPQMKLEKLQQMKSRHSILKTVLFNGLTDITELVTDEIKTKVFKDNLVKLNDEQFNITCSEWIKKKNEKSNVPVSTKMTFTLSVADFVTKFINEINDLTSHIDRVRQQFRAAKQARQLAMEQDDVITIHLDWSENFNLKQARQEKASYYYEQHISILSGYLWKKNDCYSFGSISDDTNHKSEATWTGLQNLLNNIKNDSSRRITTLNFISDSPISQYRNKTTFYFLKQYAVSNQMTVKWIYMESGHGKGVADAVGAVIKRLMDQAIALHPDESYGNAHDLFDAIKDNTNIKLFSYTNNDIDIIKKTIPPLTIVTGTASLHEVTAKPNGEIYGKNTSFNAERLLKVNF